ncbi:MAG: type II toxin-antitoxin system RelE/ParE family toxin [Sphingomonadales bacterium]
MEFKFEVRFTGAFSEWLDGLADDIAIEAIARRIARIQLGNFGDHKSVGDGVSELRIQHGPGYRVYYMVRDASSCSCWVEEPSERKCVILTEPSARRRISECRSKPFPSLRKNTSGPKIRRSGWSQMLSTVATRTI